MPSASDGTAPLSRAGFSAMVVVGVGVDADLDLDGAWGGCQAQGCATAQLVSSLQVVVVSQVWVPPLLAA